MLTRKDANTHSTASQHSSSETSRHFHTAGKSEESFAILLPVTLFHILNSFISNTGKCNKVC